VTCYCNTHLCFFVVTMIQQKECATGMLTRFTTTDATLKKGRTGSARTIGKQV